MLLFFVCLVLFVLFWHVFTAQLALKRNTGSHKTNRLGYQKNVHCEHLSSADYVCWKGHSPVKSFLNSCTLVPLCELIPSERASLQCALLHYVVIQSSIILSIPAVEICSHIQKWLEKLSVGSLIYSLNSSAHNLPFFPIWKITFSVSFLEDICSALDLILLLIISCTFHNLIFISFLLPLWFYFFYQILLFIHLWMIYLMKCQQLRTYWWLYRNLERDQLLPDLLVCVSSWPDFFCLTLLWFLVYLGNEGEQDNVAFLQLSSLCSGAYKHYLNLNWDISYCWHMLQTCRAILQCQIGLKKSTYLKWYFRPFLCKCCMISILTKFITMVINSNYYSEICGCFIYIHIYVCI